MKKLIVCVKMRILPRVVQVKVKLYLGPLAGELAAELPFTLMHPKVSRNIILCLAKYGIQPSVLQSD